VQELIPGTVEGCDTEAASYTWTALFHTSAREICRELLATRLASTTWIAPYSTL